MRIEATLLATAVCLGGCASGSDVPAQGLAYDAPEVTTGSNIPSRQRRVASSPEEIERARQEAEAIRANQVRSKSPKGGATP
jgi:hypothetical protein